MVPFVLVQYNTCFWALVHSGKAPAEAQALLKVIATDSARFNPGCCDDYMLGTAPIARMWSHRARKPISRMSCYTRALVSTTTSFQPGSERCDPSISPALYAGKHRLQWFAWLQGSVVLRRLQVDQQDSAHQRTRMAPMTVHEDIIADRFWQENPDILQ